MKKVLSLFLALFMLSSVNIFSSSNNKDWNTSMSSSCSGYAHFATNLEAHHYGVFESVEAEESAFEWYLAACNDAKGNIELPEFW